MEELTVRKTFKYKLEPTVEQAGTMEFVLRRCRELYTAALLERRDAWRMCRVNITLAAQSAQLPDIKEVRPEYQEIHSQVLQDVLTRLDRAFQAFFRRVQNGTKAGYPRSSAAPATIASPTSSSATGPHWTTGCWCSPRSGA